MSKPVKKYANEIRVYMHTVGFTNFDEEMSEWLTEQQLIDLARRGGLTELEIFASIFMAAAAGVRLREFWRKVLVDEARRRNEAHGVMHIETT